MGLCPSVGVVCILFFSAASDRCLGLIELDKKVVRQQGGYHQRPPRLVLHDGRAESDADVSGCLAPASNEVELLAKIF